MKRLWMLSIFCLLFPVMSTRADEGTTAPAPEVTLKNYRVELVEFRIVDPDTAKVSTRDLVKSWDQLQADGKISVVDTFDLVTVPGQEATLHEGMQMSVTQSVAFTQQGRARQTRAESLGTVAKLTMQERTGSGFLLQLSYESSRHQEPAPDDAPPTMASFQIRSTVVVETGKPLIIAGSRSTGSTLLRIVVEE